MSKADLLQPHEKEWLEEVILAYGFRSAVILLQRRGWDRSDAQQIVQEVHNGIPGAKVQIAAKHSED